MSKQTLGKSIINKFFDKSFFETEIGRPRNVGTWKIIRAIIYKLCTGIQWKYLPFQTLFKKDKYSWQSIYYHYNKWSNKDVFNQVLQSFIIANKHMVDCTIVNMDGSHTLAKKGGEKTAYQGRKKAITSNIIFLADQQGLPLACSDVISGNHNDAFELEKMAAKIFSDIEECSINLDSVFLNAL